MLLNFLKYRKTKPFIGFEYSRDLTHFTKNGSVNEMSFFAGAWTKFENKVLLKGNLKAVYNHSFPESTSALFNVETGYQFADNFAVTLNGDYVFYSHNVQDYDIESSFGGGVLIKYLF